MRKYFAFAAAVTLVAALMAGCRRNVSDHSDGLITDPTNTASTAATMPSTDTGPDLTTEPSSNGGSDASNGESGAANGGSGASNNGSGASNNGSGAANGGSGASNGGSGASNGGSGAANGGSGASNNGSGNANGGSGMNDATGESGTTEGRARRMLPGRS